VVRLAEREEKVFDGLLADVYRSEQQVYRLRKERGRLDPIVPEGKSQFRNYYFVPE